MPLTVSATSAFGPSSPSRKPRTRRAARRGRGRRTRATSQPKARSFSSRSPSARISSVGLSDCSSLRSTITQSRAEPLVRRAPGAPPSSGPPAARRRRSSRRRGRRARGAASPRRCPRPLETPSRAIPSSPRSPARRRPGGRRARRAGAAAAAARDGIDAERDAAPRTGRARRAPSRRRRRRGRGARSRAPATFSSSKRRWTTRSSALKLDPRWPEPARFTATSAFSRHMSARSASGDRGLPSVAGRGRARTSG